MRTVYIERSTGSGRGGEWTDELDLSNVGRFIVGTGPGSFAGVRAALAFAQGYAVGSGCDVLGLPSPCACVEGPGPLAVVGDSRRGKYWIALFDGFHLEREIFQVERDELRAEIGMRPVVTPDAARIDALLRDVFGETYLGGRVPTADGLRRYAEADPGILVREPLPIYLNPAVA